MEESLSPCDMSYIERKLTLKEGGDFSGKNCLLAHSSSATDKVALQIRTLNKGRTGRIWLYLCRQFIQKMRGGCDHHHPACTSATAWEYYITKGNNCSKLVLHTFPPNSLSLSLSLPLSRGLNNAKDTKKKKPADSQTANPLHSPWVQVLLQSVQMYTT